MLRKQTLTSNEEKKRKNFKTIPSAKDNQKKEKRNENINTCTPDSKATPFSSIHFLHHTKFTSIKLHPAYRQGRGERSLSNRVDKNVADHRMTINHRCPPSSLRAHLKFMFPLPVSSEANAGREKEKKKKREEKKGREKGETEKATPLPPPPPSRQSETRKRRKMATPSLPLPRWIAYFIEFVATEIYVHGGNPFYQWTRRIAWIFLYAFCEGMHPPPAWRR